MFEDDGMPNKFLVQPMTEPAKTTAVDDARKERTQQRKRLKRIPVSVAKFVAKDNACRQVILLAWDGELTHIVTYGISADDCAQAAAGGNMLKEKWGWPECNDQPSRVAKLQTQLSEQRTTIDRLEREALKLEGHPFGSLYDALKMAQAERDAACAALGAYTLEADEKFETHTKHVSAFLKEMYEVMVDPLDSSGLKVAEMTATLLDAAKRDRETANLHADALGALQGELRQKQEEIQQADSDRNYARSEVKCIEAQVSQLQTTISQAREFLEAIVIAFKEPDGGPCFKLRAFAEKQGIYADDLGRDRVMLRIAQAALAICPAPASPKGE